MKQFAKAILSAKNLRTHLYTALDLWDNVIPTIEDYDEDYEIDIKIQNRYLTSQKLGFTINIEHRGDFDGSVSIKQIKRLFRVCSQLEDQPISLSISDNDSWIHLSDIVI